MGAEGYNKADFQKLRRLKCGYSQIQPRLIVRTLGGEADKKSKNYRNNTQYGGYIPPL